MKKGLFIKSILISALFISACSNPNTATNNQTSTSKQNENSQLDAADKAFKDSLDLSGINKDKQAKEENGKRIVVDSVAIAQITDILGINLVGVPTTKTGKMPARYKDIYQIGMAMNPSMEVIQSLKPDIVYAPDTLRDWLNEGFTKNNIKHEYLNLRSVEALHKTTEQLAKTYSKETTYEKLLAEKESFLKDYKKRIENKKKPKVLILMGLPGSYIAATENSYIGSLVSQAGGQNIVTSKQKEFEQVNLEHLLAQQPDYILRTTHAMPDVVQKMFDEEFKKNPAWSHFKAVKEKKVIDLDSSIFGMTATFEYDKGLKQLEEIFYKQ